MSAQRRGLKAGQPRAACLKVLGQLSKFLDDELSRDICKAVRKHLDACPNCEIFSSSLRQTINLCRHSAYDHASPALKARLRREILKAAGRS